MLNILTAVIYTTPYNNYSSMNDTINVHDPTASPNDINMLLKADFVVLRKLCDDSAKGFSELGGKPLEVWTSQTVSKCQKITKLFLFEHLEKFIKLCNRVCDRHSKIPSNDGSVACNNDSIKVLSDQFATYIKHAENSLEKHTTQLASITAQLCELQSCVDGGTGPSNSSSTPNPECDKAQTSNTTGVHSPVTSFSTPSDMKCHESYNTHFLDTALYDELADFLSNEKSFVDENGHSVVAYGERYRYSGGKAPNNKPTPGTISKVMDQINSKFNSSVNSVLINKYYGVDSYLPEHSDNESSIDPESTIYTLSVGQSRDVVFTDKHSKVETVLSVEDNSLYLMTRHSQNCYTHKIDKDEIGGLRYSLTFRVVGNTFRRSTIIIGDSNSKHLTFGEGSGKFGKGLPGKRVKASQIKDISPLDCMSYSNVVLICGINDLRTGTNIDVGKTFHAFKAKVDEICQLKRNINVLISPILPCRSTTFNARAVTFNRLIYSKIIDGNYYRCSVLDVSSMCDFTYRTNLLDPSYSRGDAVHLNHRGTRKLATIVKDSVYRIYNSGKGSRIDSKKPYSAALQGGPPGAGTPATS